MVVGWFAKNVLSSSLINLRISSDVPAGARCWPADVPCAGAMPPCE